MKQIFTAIIALALVFPASVFSAPPVLVNLNAVSPAVKAHSYLVVDAASGKQLAAKNENWPIPPASMTKLLTALVVLDANPTLKGTATALKSDEVGGSRIGFKTGQVVKCADLLYATLVPSANNATQMFVRCSGLSLPEVIARMNKKALDLGATKSYFVEPTGLSEVNTTTAEDYIKIAKAAFAHPAIKKASVAKIYTFKTVAKKPVTFTVRNTNRMLSDADVVVEAGKTGFIYESGYNLVSQLSFNGIQKVLVVVMGSPNKAAEAQSSKDLAKWVWHNYAWDIKL